MAKRGAKKPAATFEELAQVAENFNTFMFDEGEGIPTDEKETDEKELLKEITEAAQDLEETDVVTAATADTLEKLGIDCPAQIAEEEEQEEEEGSEEQEEEEQEEEEGPDMTEEIAKVKKARKLDAVKAIAKEQGIRIPPPFLKDLKKMKEYVTGKLGDIQNPPEEQRSGTDRRQGGDRREGGERRSAPPKKVGVIQTIRDIITDSGKKGVSKEDILAALVKKFPDRAEAGMKTTINVQLPNRISNKNFTAKKLENGNFTAA